MAFFREKLPGMPRIRQAEVAAAIEAAGVWKRDHEWRISTVTTTQISRTNESLRHRAYLVRVECEFDFRSYSPTMLRAIEVAARYESLVQQLWHEMGWPSWASRKELEPASDAV